MWVPELKKVPMSYIHDPWNIPEAMQEKCGIQIADFHTDTTKVFYRKAIQCAKYTSPEATQKMAKMCR